MAENKKKNKKSKKDFKSWKSLGICGQILEAIKELGFVHPTEIQTLTIPAAIEKKDIIGAAETGSGKTLAFAIPIIDGILKDEKEEKKRKKEQLKNIENTGNLENDEDVESDNDDFEESDNEDFEMKSDYEDFEIKSDNEDFVEESEDSSNNDVDEINPVNLEGYGTIEDLDAFDYSVSTYNHCNPLQALIITPTRELAVQIKNHIDSILTKTNIKSEVVIGGMSADKQERLLSKGPQIVIGTPGRLFQLIQEGNPHLMQLSSIKYLAIDETDRMLEKGHFEELHSLLKIINSDPEAKSNRQTFVFSATLSLVHDVPKRVSLKKGKKATKVSSSQKINKLMRMIGVKDKNKIVDVTTKQATAKKLTESKIFCSKEDKELYLYYFIKTYPGRTLIFCNSINCVKRLHKVFQLLECNPKTLHSSKNQKQRLNSLEKFTSNNNCMLLATDVAARGLDIPHVKYIIHYEIPTTAESYVHRSGRTARAMEEGLSLMLVEPADVKRCEHICKTLNKSTKFRSLPINHFSISQMRKNVTLAKEIETSEHSINNSEANESWDKKMCKAADLEWQSDEEDERSTKQFSLKRKRINNQTKRNQLKGLLVPQASDKFNNYSFRCGVIVTQSKEVLPERDALSELPKKKFKKN